MTRFTDSPYEKMMQQVPTERRGVHIRAVRRIKGAPYHGSRSETLHNGIDRIGGREIFVPFADATISSATRRTA